MINHLALPRQVHAERAASLEALGPTTDIKTGHFGAVLAAVTGMEDIQEQTVNPLAEMLVELINLETVEEVEAFLLENNFDQGQLFEVLDGHFLFSDESTVSMLKELLPTLDLLNVKEMEEGTAVDLKELLPLLEELNEEVLRKAAAGELPENLSQDDLTILLAIMQVAVIEGPKVDLTSNHEQILHTLQTNLQSFSNQLGEQSESKVQKLPYLQHTFKIPNETAVQLNQVGQTVGKEVADTTTTGMKSNYSLPKSAHETMGQQNFFIPSAVGVESIKAGEEAQRGSRAEMLIQELQNIFKRANLGQAGGTNRISIKLYPEHLGQLRIELLQTNGLLTARILASNALGKEMLESQLHQLRQAFLQQNIQVERIDVSQMLTETPQHERNEAFNKQFKQQQEQTNEQNQEEADEETMTFSEYMIELEG